MLSKEFQDLQSKLNFTVDSVESRPGKEAEFEKLVKFMKSYKADTDFEGDVELFKTLNEKLSSSTAMSGFTKNVYTFTNGHKAASYECNIDDALKVMILGGNPKEFKDGSGDDSTFLLSVYSFKDNGFGSSDTHTSTDEFPSSVSELEKKKADFLSSSDFKSLSALDKMEVMQEINSSWDDVVSQIKLLVDMDLQSYSL